LLRIHPPTRSNSRYATRCLSLCCTNSPLYRIGDLNQRGRRLRVAGRVSSRDSSLGVSRWTEGPPMRGGEPPPLIRSGTLNIKPAPSRKSGRVKRQFKFPYAPPSATKGRTSAIKGSAFGSPDVSRYFIIIHISRFVPPSYVW